MRDTFQQLYDINMMWASVQKEFIEQVSERNFILENKKDSSELNLLSFVCKIIGC